MVYTPSFSATSLSVFVEVQVWVGMGAKNTCIVRATSPKRSGHQSAPNPGRNQIRKTQIHTCDIVDSSILGGSFRQGESDTLCDPPSPLPNQVQNCREKKSPCSASCSVSDFTKCATWATWAKRYPSAGTPSCLLSSALPILTYE